MHAAPTAQATLPNLARSANLMEQMQLQQLQQQMLLQQQQAQQQAQEMLYAATQAREGVVEAGGTAMPAVVPVLVPAPPPPAGRSEIQIQNPSAADEPLQSR